MVSECVEGECVKEECDVGGERKGWEGEGGKVRVGKKKERVGR